jgi:UDPglucose 6-dehydrogenase
MPDLDYADSATAAAAGADALIVATPWPEFGQISPAAAADVSADRIVVDACHALEADRWEKAGWRVHSLTGPHSAPAPEPALEEEYVSAR